MEQQVHRLACAKIEELASPESRGAFGMGDAPLPAWTPTAKVALTKLVLTQMDALARDLEAFARYRRMHASNIMVRI